jgi:hypothetical protein
MVRKHGGRQLGKTRREKREDGEAVVCWNCQKSFHAITSPFLFSLRLSLSSLSREEGTVP